MGLDSVEIVMKVENHFDISIPDDVAEKLSTVGLLHEYVYAELQRKKRRDVGYSQVFDDIRDILVKQLGIDSRQIQRESHFIHDLRID
jgi:acyl carrier protein